MFVLIEALYWLCLAIWFGGAVFAAVVPPIVLRVVRKHDPTLPRVISVNLEGQHSTLLAGAIVAEILQVLFAVEAVCAAILLPAIAAQWFYVELQGAAVVQPLLRTALYIAGVVFLLYNWRVQWPAVLRHRDEYVENADDPDIANAALDQFDRQTATSALLLQLLVFVLTGLVLFSASIVPATIRFGLAD